MSKRPNANFEQILQQSGIPTTEAELEAKLKEEVAGAGSNLSNDAVISPFWSWVRAAVITPTVWLIRTLLAGYILPNMFVATAERWALELKAWELNITIKEAVKTQGLITLTKANADDEVFIEAGSIIQTSPIDGRIVKLKVLTETVINTGVNSGKVAVEAAESGIAYNLPAGYFNILPFELPGIISAVNEPDWITTLGADAESDEELALRLQNAFTSAGSWHIDDAYRSIISNVAGIRSDNIFFENTGHIIPGSATAYILMEVGATPQIVLNDLNQHIINNGHHGHGDLLTCAAIPDHAYDLIAELVLATYLNDEQKAEQITEVESRIKAAFRETASFTEITRVKPQSRFSLSQLSTEIHNNMTDVKSIKILVDGYIYEDIVSALKQPRIDSLIVREAE